MQGASLATDAPPKVKVPKPKGFCGNQNAKELENFLWDMKRFFQAAHVLDGEKVQITSMYLSGDAKLWWQTREKDEKEPGKAQITTWETLKKEIKDQFFPSTASWMARESLKGLKKRGTVRDYVKDFSSLMLNINVFDDDKLFDFMSGL